VAADGTVNDSRTLPGRIPQGLCLMLGLHRVDNNARS